MDKFTNQNFIDILLNSLDIRRCGRDIYFTGVTAIPLSETQTVPSGAYHQTISIFEKVKLALQGYGAELNNLIACTIHLKSLQDTEQFGLAFNDIFGLKKIQASVLVADGFSEENLLIRIDAHAYLDKTFDPNSSRQTSPEVKSTPPRKILKSPQAQPSQPKSKAPAKSKKTLGALKEEKVIPNENDKIDFNVASPTQLTFFENQLSGSIKKLEKLIDHQQEIEFDKNEWAEKCRQELARHEQMKSQLKRERQQWKKDSKEIDSDILKLRRKIQEETDQLNKMFIQNKAIIARIDSMLKSQPAQQANTHQLIDLPQSEHSLT